MRARFAFALTPLALLAACGDGVPFTGEARGGEAARCTCVTTALQEKLPAEEFTKMAKGDLTVDVVTLTAIAAADQSCAAK
jgi:hypothetical protein